jgi:hypothetical protein
MKKKSVNRRSKNLSVCAIENKLYERDFYKWTQTQASLLRKGNFTKVDLEHLVEEIESLGRSDKKKLYSFILVLLQHLLKEIYTPENKGNSKSWEATILNCRIGIKNLLQDSPSLKRELTSSLIDETYSQAREIAIIETSKTYIQEEIFPEKCPWTLKEILGE